MANISMTHPDIQDASRGVKPWLIRSLRGESAAYPGPAVPVYYRGSICLTASGHWQRSGTILYVGQHSGDPMNDASMSRADQLGITMVIAAYFQLATDPEVLEAFTQGLSQMLVAQYNQTIDALITSSPREPVVEIAMGAGKIAGRVGDSWFLPTGEPVELDASWTRVQL